MPVLIVGGAVSGLSSAAFLAQHGVSCLLAERRDRLSQHPRMSDIGPRAMELLRVLGVHHGIRRLDEDRDSTILRVDTLAGRELGRYSMGGPAEFGGLTPEKQVWCDQDQLEPILRDRAAELGAELRFGTELTGFEQDGHLVRAELRDAATGRRTTVVADYLLACDGSGSPIREALGIGYGGPGLLANQAGILFRADLTAALRGRSFVLCMVDDLDASASGVRLNILLERNLNRWTLSVPHDPRTDDGLSQRRCAELVRRAVGVADLAVEVLGVDIWQMRALLADSFGRGRVFLVGDAAKTLPPTGGYGGNSCLEDAHNLAWKLALVLAGTAGPELLDSYESERKPVAQLLIEDSVVRAGLLLSGAAEGGSSRPADQPSKASICLGTRYRTGALIAEEPDAGDRTEDPRAPTGRPGTRAPHVVLDRGGREISTLDLFGSSFVLLTGPSGASWERAAGCAGAGLTIHRIATAAGPDAALVDTEGRWGEAYGVSESGAVLVRPDGVIAWRGRTAETHPDEVLAAVLRSILGGTATAGLASPGAPIDVQFGQIASDHGM
ncbi:FAD-dependent monooxygenase [Nocardia sp. BMG51109]|uniref:FAD-dependent monooxygenase n=1 Tax=Nocardia sp. BMG51109 TaxID=1056816 RepID=UPI0006858685|nr:FAD-dependent monooxygenase [Nocardia sp. BMG51109]